MNNDIKSKCGSMIEPDQQSPTILSVWPQGLAWLPDRQVWSSRLWL